MDRKIRIIQYAIYEIQHLLQHKTSRIDSPAKVKHIDIILDAKQESNFKHQTNVDVCLVYIWNICWL
jgi:translation elongation factor P/translation initiation factor 5A